MLESKAQACQSLAVSDEEMLLVVGIDCGIFIRNYVPLLQLCFNVTCFISWVYADDHYRKSSVDATIFGIVIDGEERWMEICSTDMRLLSG